MRNITGDKPIDYLEEKKFYNKYAFYKETKPKADLISRNSELKKSVVNEINQEIEERLMGSGLKIPKMEEKENTPLKK